MPNYRGFGLREEWLRIFLDDPENFWQNEQLGIEIFKGFAKWGKDSGLLDKKKLPLEVVGKFISLGADSLKVWGYIFVNLAYNSKLINLFLKRCALDEPCNNDFLMEMLGSSYSDATKKIILRSLKSTLRFSPIGEEMGQGICEVKGNSVVSITRTEWQNPEPLVILYSLYKFAEHSENLHSFTLTNLLDDGEKREALSPKILFGLDKEILCPLLQGLANDYSAFIRVNFNKGIQENIFLNKEKKSEDAVQLF